jgi:phosphoribosylformylglycinamidine cyclo-ligase
VTDSAHGRGSAYGSAGVDYETLDAGKRDALSAALTTSNLLAAAGGRAIDESRGEPAFVFEVDGQMLAFVLETLGTKSIIARQVDERLGINAFDNIAYDAVAAVVNDLCCVGALPLVVNAYFATGAAVWYENQARHAALLEGWRGACTDAGATWGGGESPTLPELIAPSELELAGSAIGRIPEGQPPILGAELVAGDELVLVESTGLHANGASLARMVAGRLKRGYGTPLPSGRAFGEALLDRSAMYVPLVRALLRAGVDVHYFSHITGHGLLKLMRPRRNLSYEVTRLPDVPEVLGFLVEQAGMSPAAAYSTLNMGCGFAVYSVGGSGPEVVRIAADVGLGAQVAGTVGEGPRRVVLAPIGVTYDSHALDLAPRHRGAGN